MSFGIVGIVIISVIVVGIGIGIVVGIGIVYDGVDVVSVDGKYAGMVNKVVRVDALEGLGGVVQNFDENSLLRGHELACEERPDRPVPKGPDAGDGRLLQSRDLPNRPQDDGLTTRGPRVLRLLARPRDAQHFHLCERLLLLLLLLLLSLGCSGHYHALLLLGLCGK